MLRVALVTILAREMRLKFFEVDQALEMLRVALVTILLAREMRLKFVQVDQFFFFFTTYQEQVSFFELSEKALVFSLPSAPFFKSWCCLPQ